MSASHNNRGGNWRTLLVLGRVSNLPTVWSNCLAGWWLGGGGAYWRLWVLCFGATCLYVGGMFLNDAFDAEFDRQHRRERPIPSGLISIEAVLMWSLAWMIAGLASLACLGGSVLFLAVLLGASIVLYDAVHKAVTFSPVLMASCRFFLFLAAAATGDGGVTGIALWSAFALAAYIVGLSYAARLESTPGVLRYWPFVFLAGPVALAFIVNLGEFRTTGFFLSAIVLSWIGWCLRNLLWTAHPHIGRAVSGLLAGIVLVDLLALCVVPAGGFAVFALLFLSALLFQRFIPAT